MVLRYHPRDITSVMIYQEKHSKDQFLTRAHAIGWETEALSLAEAQAMSRRLRQAGHSVSNQSLLDKVRLRDVEVSQHLGRQRRRRGKDQPTALEREPKRLAPPPPPEPTMTTTEAEGNDSPPVIAPKVQVHDYEELKRNYGW